MIRPFSLPDLDPVLQIERQAFPKSPYDWMTFVNLYRLYPETFLVYVESPADWREGRILGYVIFSGNGHIISIAVHPDHRRKGIGKELLERATRKLDPKNLWAEVRKSNQGAQAFYRQMGFKVVGIVPDYYGNEDALIVRWTRPG